MLLALYFAISLYPWILLIGLRIGKSRSEAKYASYRDASAHGVLLLRRIIQDLEVKVATAEGNLAAEKACINRGWQTRFDALVTTNHQLGEKLKLMDAQSVFSGDLGGFFDGIFK